MRHFCKTWGTAYMFRKRKPPVLAQYPAKHAGCPRRSDVLWFVLLFACPLAAQTADYIWSARYVISMDPSHRVIENGAVAVRGEQILAVGTKTEIEQRFQARQHLDRPDALIAPGLINTHTHAAMSLFRGISDDLALQEWLVKFIFPAEARNLTPEFVRAGTRLACLEMLLGGVTTYADMYYFEEIVAEATREAGMRGVLGQSVIGFPVADAKTPAEALARAEKFIARYRDDRLIVPALAPHSIYTVSDDTLRQVRALADRTGAPVLIHLSETRRENEEALAKRHMTPTAVLESLGFFKGRTLAAHGVWLNDADMQILKARNVGIAHCPSSNMKLASGVAPVVKMLALDLAVGLGTDGPAGSNNDFNLFEEMDLAAKLQKVTTLDPQALPARAALEMATLRGARALGMDREIGSLEAGKRADMITVRLDQPHAVPMYDVYSQMVYALKASDVADVMVNGKPVVRDGRILTLDSRQVLAQANEYRSKIQASLKAH